MTELPDWQSNTTQIINNTRYSTCFLAFSSTVTTFFKAGIVFTNVRPNYYHVTYRLVRHWVQKFCGFSTIKNKNVCILAACNLLAVCMWLVPPSGVMIPIWPNFALSAIYLYRGSWSAICSVFSVFFMEEQHELINHDVIWHLSCLPQMLNVICHKCQILTSMTQEPWKGWV